MYRILVKHDSMTYTRGQNGQIEAKFNNSNRQNVQNAQYVFKETEYS